MFSGLEEEPVEFGFVIFKAFGVEYSKQTGLCFPLLQRHLYYRGCALWCSLQLGLLLSLNLESVAQFRKSPAALGWGFMTDPGSALAFGVPVWSLFSLKTGETLCRLVSQ